MKKCNLCNKPDKLHYRIKSIIHKDWIFCCKECWNGISTHDNYSYGGTRKSKKFSRELTPKNNKIIRDL